MDEALYREIFDYQKEHWFFAAKGYFADALIGQRQKSPSFLVADVGCGTGPFIPYLRSFGRVVGLDMSPAALEFAVKSESTTDTMFVRSTAGSLPIKSDSVDMVCLTDVLCHGDIKNIDQVLTECRRILKKGGKLLLSDPAFSVLKSEHDESAHATRRFTAKEVKNNLERNGFRIRRLSYTFMALFPVAMSVRFIRGRFFKKGDKPRFDFHKAPFIFDMLARGVFFIEAVAVRFISLPFGVSVMAIGEKVINEK